MEELKPCPFCGGEATIELWSRTGAIMEQWFFNCHCTECFAGVIKGQEEEAVEAWNKRV